MGAIWYGLVLKTDVDTLRAKSDVGLPSRFVRQVPGSSWLAVDGYEWVDFPEDGGHEHEEVSRLSEAFGCHAMLLFGTGRSEGLSAHVFHQGRCVRALDSMSGVWVVRGDEVQGWERAVVERGIPDDVYKPAPEHYEDGDTAAYEDARSRYEAELEVYGAADQRVIEECVFVDGATLPRASDHDLKGMGFDAHVWGGGERIEVREAKRGWFSRFFGG